MNHRERDAASPSGEKSHARRLLGRGVEAILLLSLLLGPGASPGAGDPAPSSSRTSPARLAIREVVTWPGGTLQAGDALVVSATATPGGIATFDVGEVAHGMPMAETSPGHYRGIMVVSRSMRDAGAPVSVRLVLGSLEMIRESAVPVAFDSPLPSSTPWVRVTFPVNEQNVPPVFSVAGQAPADAEVEVRATTLRRYVLGIDAVEDHGITVAVGRANGQGNFAVPMDLGIVPRGDVIRIEVCSRSQGRQSSWYRYEVKVSDYY